MTVLQDLSHHPLQLERSKVDWLAAIQTEAFKQLNRLGLPTRHDEDWKYTPLDDAAQHMMFKRTVHDIPCVTDASRIPVSHQLILDNGRLYGADELKKILPQGVFILPLATAIAEHEALVKPYLQQIMHVDHGIQAINTAMIHDGVFIYVPQGVQVNTPIALVHRQHQNHQTIYLRHLIVAESDSECCIVEEYQGDDQHCYLTNTLTEIQVGARAKVVHYKIQRESRAAYHFGHIFVKQMAHSQFDSHSVSLGAKLARSDLSIDLFEPHAACVMNGIYTPGEGQHMDSHTVVNHLVPDCKSTQDYKGIISGKSRAVFNGKVFVAKDAQHTDANQHNKNLLLSPHAEINTKPQLEIFADDVLCAHGATVGQLDEEALFYLATRGIDRAEASQYLIHAFANDNVRLMPHQALAEWVSGQIAL